MSIRNICNTEGINRGKIGGRFLAIDTEGDITQTLTENGSLKLIVHADSALLPRVEALESEVDVLQEDVVDIYTQINEQNVPLGYLMLDGDGKISSSYLPSSVFEYKGMYNIITNTPTLVNGVGNIGDVYECSVAGSRDFGDGVISVNIGDWLIYNGSIYEVSIHTGYTKAEADNLFLMKSGGTMSGNLNMSNNNFIHMGNNDIIKINGVSTYSILGDLYTDVLNIQVDDRSVLNHISKIEISSSETTITGSGFIALNTNNLITNLSSGVLLSTLGSISTTAQLNDSFLNTITTSGKIANSSTTATASIVSNSIMLRDANGDTNINKLISFDIETFGIQNKGFNVAGIVKNNSTGVFSSGLIVDGDITNLTITGGKLADNTITGGKIANLTITGGKIENNTITGNKIENNTITNNKLSTATANADNNSVALRNPTGGCDFTGINLTTDYGINDKINFNGTNTLLKSTVDMNNNILTGALNINVNRILNINSASAIAANSSYIQLGADLPVPASRETFAGAIIYQPSFCTDAMALIGAGTVVGSRIVHTYDSLRVGTDFNSTTVLSQNRVNTTTLRQGRFSCECNLVIGTVANNFLQTVSVNAFVRNDSNMTIVSNAININTTGVYSIMFSPIWEENEVGTRYTAIDVFSLGLQSSLISNPPRNVFGLNLSCIFEITAVPAVITPRIMQTSGGDLDVLDGRITIIRLYEL
jgi:hypothetical protein